MNLNKQLQQEIYEKFMQRPQNLFTFRHLSKLFDQEYLSVEDVFNARFNESFISNISNKQAFLKTIQSLELIISSEKKMKLGIKSKGIVVLQNDMFLKYYLKLMFSKHEKNILFKMIHPSFDPLKKYDESDQSQDQNSAMQILFYIFKNLFMIGCPQEAQKSKKMLSLNNQFDEFDDLGV